MVCALLLQPSAGAQIVTATIPVGTYPVAVAVNPVTNKIYVAISSGTVTVIDGATNTVCNTCTVAAGTTPYAVAVNPATNKIYVANQNSNDVTVIDGTTNAATTVAAGSFPHAVAANPVTNKIYVANYGSGTVTVIDGATNATTTVMASSASWAVAVNPVTNKIYVANYSSNDVTVIDGVTNATTTVAVGMLPEAVAVNQVTNRTYVANAGSNSVTVIGGGKASASILLSSSPNPSGQNQSVTFTATVSSAGGAPSGSVSFQDGATMLAMVNLTGGVATFSTSALTLGTHSITAVYSGDVNFNAGTSPAVIQKVLIATTTALAPSPNPSIFNQSVTLTATITAASGTPNAGTVNFMDGSTLLSSAPVSAGVATTTTATLAAGSHPLSAVYSGDGDHLPREHLSLCGAERERLQLYRLRFRCDVQPPASNGGHHRHAPYT